MPGPILGSGPAWEGPPISLIDIDRNLYEYLLMIHVRLFGTSGTGDLDSTNVSALTHASLASVTAFQHHGTGSHGGLDQSAASADASASSVSVTTADATVSTVSVTSANASDLATVITLANEIKGDVNTLVTDLNTSANLANEMKGDINTLVTDANNIKASLNDLKAKMRTAGLLTA